MNKQADATAHSAATVRRLVLRSTIGAFAVRVCAALASLLVNILLARTLPLPDYGVVALGLSWLMIAGTIACFGTDAVALRFVAEGKASGDAAKVRGVAKWGGGITIWLGTSTALFSVAVAPLLFPALSASQLTAFCLIALAIPLFAFALNRASVLRGGKRAVSAAVIELLLRPVAILLLTAAVIVVVGSAFSAALAAVVVFAAQAITAGVGLALGRTVVGVEGPTDTAQRMHWRAIAVPVALMNSMAVVIANIDTVLVGYFIDAESAGVYRASAQLSALVSFGLAASNGIIAPLIAEFYRAGRLDELQRVLKYSTALVASTSVTVVAVMALMGPFLLSLFGSQYEVGYCFLLVLLVGQAVNALCGPTGFMMTMTGHQRSALAIFVACTALNVALNIALIPAIGAVGAAVSSAAGLAAWNIAVLVFLRRRLHLDPSVLAILLKPRAPIA